jgi:hypothetical protein
VTTWKTPEPMVDSDVNARLRSLKAAAWDNHEAIGAALDVLLASLEGRHSLVQHLADMASLATEPSMTDQTRGRVLRRHFEPMGGESTPPPSGGLMARLAARRFA